MPFVLSLKNLIRRDAAASLRERAASLQTDLARVIRQPTVPAAEPEDVSDARDADLLALQPEWEARAAAYTRALEEQGTISDNAPSVEAPPPREPFEQWAKLIPGWRERTGVDAAEAATNDAMDDLCEIEDRISNMPATTLAGLRLKARVAQRNDDVAWPDELGTGLVRDILALGEPAVEADAELIRLGAQFEAARAREIAACEACNAAQHEADRHMPRRPATLIYRASDEALGVYQYLTDPEGLNGVEISNTDVARLRRIMPMIHEVLRPIRQGERSHRDHPGRKFDIVPYPEAQARAEEIVTVWDAWRAEQSRVQDEHVTPDLEDAAERAGEAATSIVEQIARLPAHTAAGFRVKLRALSHYRPKALLPELPELPDPDQILSHSLWRDMQGEAQQPVIEKQALATLNRPAGADPVFGLIEEHRTAYAEWDRVSDVWSEMLPSDPGYAEAVATSDGPAQREIAAFYALSTARPATLQGVAALAEYLREATGSTGFDLKPSAAEQGLSTIADALRTLISTDERRPAPSPVDMIDFASASLDDLQSLHDIADLVGGVAYATVWTARCKARGRGDEPNAAGRLMQWLGDALTDVETAANNEARRRAPTNNADRETRLEMLALQVIQNGDPDETEVFARELLAHVEAERQGR